MNCHGQPLFHGDQFTLLRATYAIAMIVLRVSSMKRPSHMLRVVCGRPQKQLKGKNAPGMQEEKTRVVKSLSLYAAHASGGGVWRACGVERRCQLLIQHSPPQMSCLRAGAASLAP